MVFGKKVGFFVGRYAQRVRQERRRPRPRPPARPKPRQTNRPKAVCRRKLRPPTIRLGPRISCPVKCVRETQGCSRRGTIQLSPTVIVANVAIPAAMVNVTHGKKTPRRRSLGPCQQAWGCIATFESEADLDRWWWVFQESMGREPRALRAGRISQPEHMRRPSRSVTRTMPRGDYLKPWSERYDMPRSISNSLPSPATCPNDERVPRHPRPPRWTVQAVLGVDAKASTGYYIRTLFHRLRGTK